MKNLDIVSKIIYFLNFYVYEKMKNKYRRKIYTYYTYKKCGSVGIDIVVNGKIEGLGSKIVIGNYSSFNNGVIFLGSGKVTIGNYFHTGRNLTIITSNHDYDMGTAIPYSPGHSIDKEVVIKDFVWLGHNVTILQGVTVGEGAVIAAGSIVSKNVPDYAVVGGIPAKVLKYRNIEHFQKLKAEGKFHN
jgi:acetyltransferase-like isoleucine patch superfamily enzyme